MKTPSYPPCFYRVSVMALILEDKKVLLVKEKDGRWSLPGGGLKVHETFFTGINRELQEEIGVIATKISLQPLYAWTFVDVYKHKNPVPKLVLAFEVEVNSFEFTNNPKESIEIGFFSAEEIENMNLHPNTQQLTKVWIN